MWWGIVRGASAHRLQRREQPSPVLLVIKEAIDLPPVGPNVRVLLLAQNVVERVSHGRHHADVELQSSTFQVPRTELGRMKGSRTRGLD